MAIKYILDYGFRKLRLHKISLRVFPKNLPTISFYKKMVFEIEGILKEEVFKEGRCQNLIIMATFKKQKKKIRMVIVNRCFIEAPKHNFHV